MRERGTRVGEIVLTFGRFLELAKMLARTLRRFTHETSKLRLRGTRRDALRERQQVAASDDRTRRRARAWRQERDLGDDALGGRQIDLAGRDDCVLSADLTRIVELEVTHRDGLVKRVWPEVIGRHRPKLDLRTLRQIRRCVDDEPAVPNDAFERSHLLLS